MLIKRNVKKIIINLSLFERDKQTIQGEKYRMKNDFT